MKKPILFIIIIALILLDFATKQLAVANLNIGEPITVIPNFLQLNLIYNKGAAFGILEEHRWVFILSTLIVVLIGFYLLLFNKVKQKLPQIAIVLIIAGGLGNSIDRIMQGQVTDFFELLWPKFFNYIFNAADIYAVVGTILLMIYFMKRSNSNGGLFE